VNVAGETAIAVRGLFDLLRPCAAEYKIPDAALRAQLERKYGKRIDVRGPPPPIMLPEQWAMMEHLSHMRIEHGEHCILLATTVNY
jgi:hypothetical protein